MKRKILFQSLFGIEHGYNFESIKEKIDSLIFSLQQHNWIRWRGSKKNPFNSEDNRMWRLHMSELIFVYFVFKKEWDQAIDTSCD